MNARSKPKIVAKGIQKSFGNVVAMEDVSLSIQEREFVAIIGPSGCGKSTFLYVIAGFEKPSGGELTLNGKPITGPGPDRGVVFQEFVLFPWLTVLRNITLGLDIQGVKREEAEERCARRSSTKLTRHDRDPHAVMTPSSITFRSGRRPFRAVALP